MKTKKVEWRTIGHVGVDSGCLMVIDPCYAIEFTKDDYSKHIVKGMKQIMPIPFKKGHAGRAVAFSSGFGDGCYEVKAKFETFKDWGERITEVRIIMK